MKTIDMRFVPFVLCLSTLLCSVCLSLVASPFGRGYFVKTTTDFVVFPRGTLPSIKNNKIRVLASPFERTEPANNLATKYTGSHFFYRELQDSKDQIVLKTSRLVANVWAPSSVGTGAVLFSDNTGNSHLQEQPVNSYRFVQSADDIIFYRNNRIFINKKPVPRRHVFTFQLSQAVMKMAV